MAGTCKVQATLTVTVSFVVDVPTLDYSMVKTFIHIYRQNCYNTNSQTVHYYVYFKSYTIL